MKRPAVLLACFFVYCLAAVPAHADPVPSCSPDTSIAALQLSGGCKSGDLLFSKFQYNNSGLQIHPGDFVTPSNILVTATPFSVTFSTNYAPDGGFSNCLPSPHGIGCIEEAGSIGFDVSVINGREQIAGLGLFGGVPSGFGGHLSEIGCLGAGNSAHVPGIASDLGILPSNVVSSVCPVDTSNAILLNGILSSSCCSAGPSAALFSPVSNISLAIGDTVATGGGPETASVSPFTDAFLLVPQISTVPEPSAWMLILGAALLTLVMKWKTLFH
jgi:hypothetical protein